MTLFTIRFFRSSFGGLRQSLANDFEQTICRLIPFQYVYNCCYGDCCFTKTKKTANSRRSAKMAGITAGQHSENCIHE